MSIPNDEKAERIGEALALLAMSDHFGSEIFIGASTEYKVDELGSIIYKDIDDPAFFGATITIDRTNRKYVLLNTSQSLRHRYFTAAHELWHVLDLKLFVNEEVNQERAADRFATALMLPESLMRATYRAILAKSSIVDNTRMVLQLADLSSAPYVAVAKRLMELKLVNEQRLIHLSEEEWVSTRRKLLLPDSPLDVPLPFTLFKAFEKRIAEESKSGYLTNLEASKKLARLSPDRAAEYAAAYHLQQTSADDDLDIDDDLEELFDKKQGENDK